MTTHLMRQILLSLTLSFSSIVHAETITGRVLSVYDGDTFTILDPNNTQFRIRLAAVDAPEKAQPFGQRGKQKLSDICYGKTANIKVVSIDRNERPVGDVNCAGVNANEAMVQSGLAWVDPRFAKGHGYLFAVEEDARNTRRGLWTDDNPIPPWKWRRGKRSN